MKKFFLATVMCMIALSTYAKSGWDEKYNVVVGTCTTGSGVYSQWAQNLKSCIVKGLSALPRCNVTDDSTLKGISAELGEALSQLRQAEIECYYIASSIESLSTSQKSSKDGKSTTYSAKMKISLLLYHVSGSLIASMERELSGSSKEGQDKAILDSYYLVDNYAQEMAENNLKLFGEIRQLQEVHPKKGAKTCYISCGANIGVTKGTRFEVYEEVDIAGDVSLEKVGELKVKEVKSGTLSLCDVSKGGKKVQEAFEAERKLYIQSRPKGLLEF